MRRAIVLYECLDMLEAESGYPREMSQELTGSAHTKLECRPASKLD